MHSRPGDARRRRRAPCYHLTERRAGQVRVRVRVRVRVTVRGRVRVRVSDVLNVTTSRSVVLGRLDTDTGAVLGGEAAAATLERASQLAAGE